MMPNNNLYFLRGIAQVSEFLQNYAPSGDKRNSNQRCACSWTTRTFARAVHNQRSISHTNLLLQS